MPHDAKGANARRTVTDLVLQYVAATKNEFSMPPAELLRLAEERASALTEEQRQRMKLDSPWIGSGSNANR